MSQRVALITGPTHGIGTPTAREIARAGYHLVLACRDLGRGAEVRAALHGGAGGLDIELMQLDLARQASIRDFAVAFTARYPSLDLLVNNAGMVGYSRQPSPDGHELTFATNHLGPFLLTQLLLPTLQASGQGGGGARIVNVASTAHYRGHLVFDDLDHARRPYKFMQVYADSKLANVLFTFALARRLAGSGITANCLHPGFVGSNIFPHGNAFTRMVGALIRRFALSEERGAQTSIHLALSRTVDGVSGQYFDEFQRVKAASAEARDEAVQDRLWAESLRRVGLPGD